MKKIVFISGVFIFFFWNISFGYSASGQDQKSLASQLVTTTVQNYLQAQQPSAAPASVPPLPPVSPAPVAAAPANISTNISGSYGSPEQNALSAILQTKSQAVGVVKSVGGIFQQYLTDKNLQSKQQELLNQFDYAFYAMVRRFPLGPEDTQTLKSRVEKAYIEDVASGRNELDQQAFRDLGYVIQKEYSEMRLSKTQNGIVDVYDFKGRVKTRWNFINGQPHGFVVTYYETGEILYVDTYEQGRKIRRKKYTPEGRLEFDEDYRVAFQPAGLVNVAQTPAAATVQTAAASVPAAVAEPKNTNESCPCKQGAQTQQAPAVAGNVVREAPALPGTQPRST